MTLDEWRNMSEPDRMEARLNAAAHALRASGEAVVRVAVTSEMQNEVAEGQTTFVRKPDAPN